VLNDPVNLVDPKGLHFLLVGRMPFFFRPRVLRTGLKNYRPRTYPKNTKPDPKYRPSRPPSPEELGAPPDDLFWQQDPSRGLLRPKPKYNPNNPPKINFPPAGVGGDDNDPCKKQKDSTPQGGGQRPWDPIVSPYT
jgi:hypothetical protein